MSRSAQRRTVLAAVCPNGLGHLRRTLTVLAALVRRTEIEKVVIVCDGEALRRTAWLTGEPQLAAISKVVTDVMVPGVRWSPGGCGLSSSALFGWEGRLAQVPELDEADLVLSDNLVGVLALRPDAVLLGSFLWMPVLREAFAGQEPVAEFVQRDSALLARHRPRMIAVEDIVMPPIEAACRAVLVPWMTTRRQLSAALPPPVPLLAVLPGSVEQDLKFYAEVAATVATRGRWVVSAPDRLRALVPRAMRHNIRTFRYTEDDFSGQSLVLARPGAGVLTECVQFGLPIVAVVEENNAEIRHLAQRAEELGFGLPASVGSVGAAVEALDQMLDEDMRKRARQSALRRPVGGVEAAAEAL
jgi:hypothetical protein